MAFVFILGSVVYFVLQGMCPQQETRLSTETVYETDKLTDTEFIV